MLPAATLPPFPHYGGKRVIRSCILKRLVNTGSKFQKSILSPQAGGHLYGSFQDKQLYVIKQFEPQSKIFLTKENDLIILIVAECVGVLK
jgi:hypothetical protein